MINTKIYFFRGKNIKLAESVVTKAKIPSCELHRHMEHYLAKGRRPLVELSREMGILNCITKWHV